MLLSMYPVDNVNNFMLCLEMYFFSIQVFFMDNFKLIHVFVSRGRI